MESQRSGSVTDGRGASDRRSFLQGVAVIGALGQRLPLTDSLKTQPQSGGVRSRTDRRANELEDAWRMFGRDAAHTGYNPAAHEITEPLELRWRFTAATDTVWSPAVVADTAYVGSKDGNLYALDTATGGERWRVTVADRASIPAVNDGTVYIVE